MWKKKVCVVEDYSAKMNHCGQRNSINYQQWQIWGDDGPFLLQIAFSSHSATGEKERVSGNHSPGCLFYDWISPYLLFLY